jgi:elongation factor Ts
MTITAAQVKELRDRTGAGMMECKKALQTSNGDMESAISELRKSGGAKADKKAGRTAAEGVITIGSAPDGSMVMVEINSETDFVARDHNFITFVDAVGKTALSSDVQEVDALLNLPLAGDSTTVEEARKALVAKVGENINIRRLAKIKFSSGSIGSYLHGNGRIGVLVELDVDNKELARDLAMHIAASKPVVIAQENVSSELVEKEKEVYAAQAATSGKPQEIIEKMVSGRVKKFLDEISLLGQPFVKDPNIQVSALLGKNRAKVISFTRYEVGEGIEKIIEDFAEAVMSQVQGG